ncbi:hypothetical protein [Caulobacter sp. RL271]|jgi:uncharacterized membrane protein YvlD (DUF360 family)|uniref:Uncharacterized protein n=1 Tax=Caulobacter segnis TaxID=88688 RepID=A0ABY4ZPL8_9CAUL|nr:hypothetical protein [Caulobacter segnis]USQ94683.1 hypothetical protein MZV50_19175 [Caulobacter segnis]
MTDGSASVGGALRAGVSDLGASINACWAALLAAVVLTVVAGYLPPGVRLLAVLTAGVIAQGALFRRAFGRAPGLKGLRWGRDEWRLLGGHLLVLGLFLLIGSILLVVIGAIALGVARASAPNLDVGSAEAWKTALANAGPGGFVAGLAPLAGLAILVWLGLRLSFTAPATVEQSGVRVLSAFPLTRGKVPKLLAISLVLAAPLLLAGLLGLTPARGPGVTAASAIFAYLLLAPAWAGALVHLYRHSAVSQDA